VGGRGGEGGGDDTHSMTTFHELFNIVHENDFLRNFLKIILVPSSYFPILSKSHYLSLLNDI
jgi:hypothetical protein